MEKNHAAWLIVTAMMLLSSCSFVVGVLKVFAIVGMFALGSLILTILILSFFRRKRR